MAWVQGPVRSALNRVKTAQTPANKLNFERIAFTGYQIPSLTPKIQVSSFYQLNIVNEEVV